MELANNTFISEISKMTVKDKQGELLNIINSFTGRLIEIIDDKLKSTRPDIIEYEYIDLLVEAFFSIKSFCVLMKEGLISSASAITRNAIEQSAIVFLVSNNEKTKESFLRIKKERNAYYTSDEVFKKQYEDNVKKEYGLKQIKIKQFFDYGWYVKDGKPTMKLKPICVAADFSEAYDLVESVINGFAHGQISVFRLSRRNDGTDASFVDRLFEIIGRVFFRVVGILYRDFGDGYFNESDTKTIDMIYAISSDLTSRLFEKDVLDSINGGAFKTKSIIKNSKSLNRLLLKYNSTNDIREKYLLSQAYIRYYKQIVAAIVCSIYKSTNDSKIESITIRRIIERHPLDKSLLSAYDSEAPINLNCLIDFLDSRNEHWLISADENIFLACAQALLNLLETKYEEVYDK